MAPNFSSSYTLAPGYVWSEWVQATGTAVFSSTNVSTTQLWVSWQMNASTGATMNYQSTPVNIPQVTEAQMAEVNRRREAAAAQLRLRNQEAAKAKTKAEQLLLSLLDKQQEEEFRKTNTFHVHTRKGERTYRITGEGFVQLVKSENGQRYTYCIHPKEAMYPGADKAAALKLLLEADESLFLKTANASRLADAA